MKVKFNHFERVAGLFVGGALLGCLALSIAVAVKKGWLTSKVEYITTLEHADGIHEGTVVQIAGLRAGAVTNVDLISVDEIRVKFEVFEKFRQRIRADSRAQVIRPFIIGEKVIDVSVGSEGFDLIAAGGEVPSVKSFDVMDLFSGRKLGPFLGTIESLAKNLQSLAEAFADPERTKNFVQMFDRLNPLIKNLNSMSIGVTKITDAANKKQRVELLLGNLTELSTHLAAMAPIMAKEAPHMAEQIPRLVENLAVLTDEFRKLTPAISAIAPELPQASRRAIEALDEVVITLKAMQKTFILSGKVEDVKEEEKKKRVFEKENNRQPAQTEGEK